MKRDHTLSSIARDIGKEKRTVQNWLQKAKADGHELGAIHGETRYFSDEERQLLLTYGSAQPSDFIRQSEIAVVQRVEIAPIEQFDPRTAIAQFDGVVGAATDPEQILALSKAMLGAATSALDSKIEAQRQELSKHQQVAKQLSEVKQQGLTDLKIKASESKQLAMLQNQTTGDLQQILQEIAALGKPTAD